VLEIVTAGGWLMLPIIVCSILALTISFERLWVLRKHRVVPQNLIEQIRRWLGDGRVPDDKLQLLKSSSPLGRVLAAGVAKRAHSREVMRQSIEEVGSHVAHELQRFLGALGTIAAITPLLGLLGTVVGMISVFTRITGAGVGNPTELAGGISQALITTAAGLMVAIPSLVMHRYFRSRVDGLVVDMEEESAKLLDVMAPAGKPE